MRACVCKASTMNYRRLQESAVPTFLFLTFLPPPATRPTLSTSFLPSFPALMGPIMFSFLRSLLLLLLLTLFGAKNHICRRRRRAFEGWTDRGEREECVSVRGQERQSETMKKEKGTRRKESLLAAKEAAFYNLPYWFLYLRRKEEETSPPPSPSLYLLNV